VRFGFVRRAIRTPRWKYIRNDPSPVIDVRAPAPVPEPLRQTLASEELYDLSADPSEQHNLIDSAPTTAAGLRSALDRYAKGTLR
jgi:arylsulfatase A-like enzyme